MPEVSRFNGIVIRMFARDHNPPHFHALCGKHETLFNIQNGSIIEGDIPANKQILVAA